VSADVARLRWRCRRGMRELDQLLGWYLDARFADAGADARRAFAALLDQQDPELWDWLMGRSRAHDPAWQRVIDEIRTRDHV
jgi:antitoxin CptB